jgi:RNA polymerase sigma-70 factor (ECF subfamily)
MIRLIGCGAGSSLPIIRSVIGSDFGNVLYRAQSGDESAFACLWCDINPTLKRYLHVIAGEVNQDVIAQTWVIVGQGLDRFKGDEMTWRSWVFATARRAEPVAFARRSLPALLMTDDDAAPAAPTPHPGPFPTQARFDDPVLGIFIGAADRRS